MLRARGIQDAVQEQYVNAFTVEGRRTESYEGESRFEVVSVSRLRPSLNERGTSLLGGNS